MLMLHKKVFHVNKKKVDVAQKSISCQQKQDDAASKKYFVRKKVIFFSERRAIQIFSITQFNFCSSSTSVINPIKQSKFKKTNKLLKQIPAIIEAVVRKCALQNLFGKIS